jgi:hypothetical protein
MPTDSLMLCGIVAILTCAPFLPTYLFYDLFILSGGHAIFVLGRIEWTATRLTWG